MLREELRPLQLTQGDRGLDLVGEEAGRPGLADASRENQVGDGPQVTVSRSGVAEGELQEPEDGEVQEPCGDAPGPLRQGHSLLCSSSGGAFTPKVGIHQRTVVESEGLPGRFAGSEGRFARLG